NNILTALAQLYYATDAQPNPTDFTDFDVQVPATISGTSMDITITYLNKLATANLGSLIADSQLLNQNTQITPSTLLDGAGDVVYTLSINGTAGQLTRLRVTL